MMKGAIFSTGRKYRYSLYRIWDRDLPCVMFIGLNPSTADETNDDPTITRCIGYAHDWGYGGLYMCNIFAFRTTFPSVLHREIDPIGDGNNHWLDSYAKASGLVVAAWGNHGELRCRGKEVAKLIPNLYCLGINKTGQPKHPLYLPKDAQLIKYEVASD